MLPARPEALRFGGVTLDLARCALLRGTQALPLRPKAFDTLRLLAENPGRLVTKDEFFAALWPGVFVTDDSLVQCITEIRRALGEDGRALIRTVPRRGYVLVADVVRAPGPVPTAEPLARPPAGQRAGPRAGFVAVCLLSALLLAALAGDLRHGPAPGRNGVASPPAAASGSGRRVALVIGNAGYPDGDASLNARRDAAAVAGALRRTGFASVTLLQDPPQEALLATLDAFARQAEEADWAVVYYVGRGIETAGAHYLVTVDAALPALPQSDRLVALDHLLWSAAPARRLRLVIFDACRTGDAPGGLVIPAMVSGAGGWPAAGATLVAFATASGTAAADGEDGANGPYSTALIAALETPGLEIGDAFRTIRDRVMQATGQRQQPVLYGSLPLEPLYFRAP